MASICSERSFAPITSAASALRSSLNGEPHPGPSPNTGERGAGIGRLRLRIQTRRTIARRVRFDWLGWARGMLNHWKRTGVFSLIGKGDGAMSLAQDEQIVSSRATIENLKVRCMVCGTVTTADVPISVCPTCGGLLDCLIPHLDQLTRSTLTSGASALLKKSGVWKYRAVLPDIPEEAVVTRFEGNTPLYFDDRIADYAGIASFGLKHEGQN